MNEAKLVTEGNNYWRLCGKIDSDKVIDLRVKGEIMLSKLSAGSVVDLDLSAMEAMDSTPVSLLLCWQRRARRAQAMLRFAAVSESLRELLELYGLHELAEGVR